MLYDDGQMPVPPPDRPRARLVVSDLDGTLLNQAKQITPKTERVLKAVTALGVPVCLCSGRSPLSMRPYVEQLGETVPFIAMNGAYIVDPHSGDLLWRRELPAQRAREAARLMESMGLYFHAYEPAGFVTAHACPQSLYYAQYSGQPGRAVGPLSQYLTRPVPKLLAICQPERASAVWEALSAQCAGWAECLRTTPEFVELVAPNVSKGLSSAWLASRLGIAPEETLAFGDGQNDVSLLRWAGTAVAPLHADPLALAAADDVCPSCEANGVASYLMTYFGLA